MLIVENIEVEMESGEVSKMTFTKSFLDDMNEMEKTVKRRIGTELTKNLLQVLLNVSKFHIMISFFCSIVLLTVLCFSLVYHLLRVHYTISQLVYVHVN